MIQIAAGTKRSDTYDSTDILNLLENIKTTLLAAGWTLVSSDPLVARGYYTGQPGDGDSLTFKSHTYRFKNTMLAANDVKIGADAATSYANLVAAFNGTGTPGVEYYAGTTASAHLTASIPMAGYLFLQQKAATFADWSETVGEGLTNFKFGSLGGAASIGLGGYTFKSGITPQGLQIQCRLQVGHGSTANAIYFLVASSGQETVPDGWNLATWAGGNYLEAYDTATNTSNGYARSIKWVASTSTHHRVIANKHQFFVINTDFTNYRSHWVFVSCPWIPDFLAPGTITGATNATPIVIEEASHGRSTSDEVVIRGAAGNTAANGLHTITYVDANHYSLDGTTGSGTYTSGGRVGNSTTQIAELGICSGSPTAANTQCLFEGDMDGSGGGTQVLFNGTTNSDEGSTYSSNTGIVLPTFSSTLTTNLTWFGGAFVACDPILQIYSAYESAGRVVGQLWDMTIARKQDTQYNTGSFLSYNWLNVTNNMSSPWAASALVLVP
jgi:hypothetical protein